MPSLAAVLPPPPPPPPPEKSAFQLQELKKNKIIKPVAIPAEKPPEKEPEAMLEESSAPAHPLSAKYGAEGGDPDTHFHPALHGKPGPIGGPVAHALGVIPFGEGMAPPKLMKDPLPIRFTREALEARVEGRAVVRCTITVEGNVENCRFLQSLPYMDEAILSALSMRTYSPATYQGKKISVDYNIPIRLKLP
jgi:protein TonB